MAADKQSLQDAFLNNVRKSKISVTIYAGGLVLEALTGLDFWTGAIIVVVITDESEHSPGQPGEWFERIAAVKNGVETNVVMLTIVESDSADHILLTQLFTNGAVGNIYEPTYDEFFVDAISGVEVACDGFIPPG